MTRWLPDGPCAFQSHDGRYNVVRSPESGFPAVYTLVKLGARTKGRDGQYFYEGSQIIATELAKDDSERKRAIDRLMEKCHDE